jgi:hypothetical protein
MKISIYAFASLAALGFAGAFFSAVLFEHGLISKLWVDLSIVSSFLAALGLLVSCFFQSFNK